ncbi:MAG: T9SS type A sorting domain-containing protein, partial [bacterium]
WKFQLRQNFPNPFSRSTRIAFTIPTKGDVRLDVYDVCGRLVSRLVDGETVPGRYEYDWDGLDSRGRRVANGVYFCRLSTGENVSTREMVVLK